METHGSTGLLLRECIGRGRHFTPADGRQTYHDRKCQKAAFERRKNAAKLKPKVCVGVKLDLTPCGIHFKPKKMSQKFHSDECQKRTRYLRDRQKNVQAALERTRRIREDPVAHAAWLAGRKSYRESNRDKISKWAHSHYVRKGKALQKSRMAAAKRLKNLEGLDLKTGLRISIASNLSLEGANLYAMRNEVYPGAKDSFDSIKKLFANHAVKIEAEKKRLCRYSEDLRRAEGERLRNRLRRELGIE